MCKCRFFCTFFYSGWFFTSRRLKRSFTAGTKGTGLATFLNVKIAIEAMALSKQLIYPWKMVICHSFILKMVIYSGFTHEKLWFSSSRCESLPESITKSPLQVNKKTHGESCLGVEYHLILAALAAVMCISKRRTELYDLGPCSTPNLGFELLVLFIWSTPQEVF